MACFLAPTAEAVIVGIVKHHRKKREETELHVSGDSQAVTDESCRKMAEHSFSKKLGWLSDMLWGGSFLLAVEHIWHGEIVPWYPFLTAMNQPGGFHSVLAEIGSTGVAMAVFLTVVWGVMAYVSTRMEKKPEEMPSAVQE